MKVAWKCVAQRNNIFYPFFGMKHSRIFFEGKGIHGKKESRDNEETLTSIYILKFASFMK